MFRRVLAAAVLAAVSLPLTTAPTSAGTEDGDSVVLVLDVSTSMSGPNLAAATEAVAAYVAQLPPEVEVGLVTFADAPIVRLDPTVDRAALDRAMRGLTLSSNTSLYDSVMTALRIAGYEGSRNVVVLTDGEDTNSRATLDEAAAAVVESGIRLDTVDVRPGQQPGPELERLAAAGHGAVVTADDADQLAHLLAELSRSTSSSNPVEPVDAPVTGRLWIVLGVCFVGFLAVIALVSGYVVRSRHGTVRTQRLIEAYRVTGGESKAATTESLREQSPVVSAVFSAATRMASMPRIAERLGDLLVRAGWTLSPAEWLVIQLSVVAGSGAVLALLTGSLAVGLVGGALLGLAGSHGWLVMRTGRRVHAFSERLPDALQLLASGLASGFALTQAVDAVAQRGPAPVAEEFAKAVAQTRLGTPLPDALDRVAQRMNSRDLELTVMSIRIQHEVGGNLAEVLRGTVATMRERAYLRRQVRTLSAEGRLSAYILIGLPIGIAAFMISFRGEYIRPLYTEPIGVAMVAAATVSLLVGSLVMRKMVKVEV